MDWQLWQASPVEPSLPPPHLASPMRELLSLLMWQLPAAQELYWHLSNLSPPPSVLTLDYMHIFTELQQDRIHKEEKCFFSVRKQ
jgi:hypothetical protein